MHTLPQAYSQWEWPLEEVGKTLGEISMKSFEFPSQAWLFCFSLSDEPKKVF